MTGDGSGLSTIFSECLNTFGTTGVLIGSCSCSGICISDICSLDSVLASSSKSPISVSSSFSESLRCDIPGNDLVNS